MAESKLNIYQKLIEVRKSVPGLSKDKENKFFKFAYVSSSQTLAAVRSEMDKQQLLLIPAIMSHETRDHKTAKGGHQFMTILTMQYTWLNAENPEEKVVCSWAGIGLDEGEKGIGKSVTYSEKYFLLKFFNIPTDKDDPDSNGRTTKQTTTKQPNKQFADDFAAGDKSDKSANDKIGIIRTKIGEMGSWGFDEDGSGKMLRHKIEAKDTIAENAQGILKRLTAFKTKDPTKTDFNGFTHTDQLKKSTEKHLNVVYGKVDKEYLEWKVKYDNSQE